MICRIHGTLEAVVGSAARVDMGNGVSYEVLVPAFGAVRLAAGVGKPVTLQTIHYLEGSSQSTSFVPRLAGFVEDADRAFFELFTSVKGIGPRKALRAMALPTAQIAGAIADRDLKTLQSLPEIGRRMAETIVATLHGKVDRFVSEAAYGRTKGNGEAVVDGAAGSAPRSAARDTLEVLLQLGEPRTQAVTWIDEVLRRNPDLDDPQRLLAEVLRLKAGP